MKKILLLQLMLALVALAPLGTNAAENPFTAQKLPFKEATIHYEVSGSGNGTETLYVRKHGRETARRTRTEQKIMMMTQQVDTLQITTPEWVYHIDMAAKSGTKAANPGKFLLEEYNKLPSAEKKNVDKNIKELGGGDWQMLGGTTMKKAEKILGYDCDVTEMMGTKIYTIHGTGIPLKSETNMMGMTFSTVAVKVDEGSSSADMFTPPSGINITHNTQADDMARSQAKHTMDMLKDPNGAQKIKENPGSLMMPMGDPGRGGAESQGPDEDFQMPSEEEMQEAMKALQDMMGK